MRTITESEILAAAPSTPFATGIYEPVEPCFGIYQNAPCRWVAVAGDIGDWAAYIGLISRTQHDIAHHGDKLHPGEMAMLGVVVEPAAEARYRP